MAPPDDFYTDKPMLEVKDSMVQALGDMVAISDLSDHGSGILNAVVAPDVPLAELAERHFKVSERSFL